VVKGLFSSLEVMKDFKFAETCKYVTLTDAGGIYPFAVVMNQQRWEKLPEDVKKVIEDLRIEQSEWTGDYMDNHVNESMKWSVDTQKVEVIKLTAAQKAEWDGKLEDITNKWTAEAKGKGLPAEAIVKDMKIAIKKYSQ